MGGPAAVGCIHPGADDNASGVAGLLELARTLARAAHPRRSVLFVAFGAREYDREGSRQFLSLAPVPSNRIVAMVNLDMIGRAENCALRVEGTGSGKGLRQLLEGLRPSVGLNLRLGRGTSSSSDHREFLGKGIPSLLFHTGLHDQYRTPADVSCLVQVEGAVEVLRLVRAVVREMADMSGRPEFTGTGRLP